MELSPGTAPIACWRSPEQWLHDLATALAGASHNGRSVRVHEGTRWDAGVVTIATILDVATTDAAAADRLTGRNVRTSHRTVATALGCSERTVQRARKLITGLGFAVEVEVGRYLTTAERQAARCHHGAGQVRVATMRHLTVPRPTTAPQGTMEIGTLPRRGKFLRESLFRSNSPTRAPRAGAASRPRSKKKPPRERPTLAVQILAGHLAARLPWLARGHIGKLCHTLTALGIDATGWTAQDVIDLLDTRNATRGLYVLPVASQRNPLALFAHQMRLALATIDEAPQTRRARIAAEAAQRRARTHTERTAQNATWEAQQHDPDAQARITQAKAQLRAHLAQLSPPRPSRETPALTLSPTGPRAWRTQLA